MYSEIAFIPIGTHQFQRIALGILLAIIYVLTKICKLL